MDSLSFYSGDSAKNRAFTHAQLTLKVNYDMIKTTEMNDEY